MRSSESRAGTAPVPYQQGDPFQLLNNQIRCQLPQNACQPMLSPPALPNSGDSLSLNSCLIPEAQGDVCEFTLLLATAAYFLAQMDQTECAKVSKRPRTCLDLPEEILEQMFGKLSVGMLSAFHHTLQLAPLEKENLTCPTGGRSPTEKKAQLPVNIQSVSPWAYRVSYDPLRYPKYIPEAYCLCKGCLVGPYGEESLQHRSTPVFMPSVILRRTRSCTGGRYVYTEYYVSIPVGCTCIPETDKETETSNSSLAKEDKVSQENGVKVGLDTGVRTDTV